MLLLDILNRRNFLLLALEWDVTRVLVPLVRRWRTTIEVVARRPYGFRFGSWDGFALVWRFLRGLDYKVIVVHVFNVSLNLLLVLSLSTELLLDLGLLLLHLFLLRSFQLSELLLSESSSPMCLYDNTTLHLFLVLPDADPNSCSFHISLHKINRSF